jgi:hypothetical protein
MSGQFRSYKPPEDRDTNDRIQGRWIRSPSSVCNGEIANTVVQELDHASRRLKLVERLQVETANRSQSRRFGSTIRSLAMRR